MSRETPRSRRLLLVLVLASLTLIVVDVAAGERSPIDVLRGATAAVLGPVQQGAAAVVTPVGEAVASVFGTGDPARRIAELERENDALRLQLRAGAEDRRRAGELDQLLQLAGDGQYRIVPARVVAAGPAQAFAATVVIDAGRRDGIAADLTVVNGDGLVGRVADVTATTATVLLVADPQSAVGVRQEGTGELGIVSGAGLTAPLDLELLDPQASLAEGDRFVTRGGAVFVAGVPVGQVVRVRTRPGALTRQARVAPYADLTALDLVGVVVQAPQRDPRDAVLPARPGAVPGRAAASSGASR